MNTTDFAYSRNLQPQTVMKYIQRHSKDFKGHIKKVNRQTLLDEVALELLDKKYPLPKPVEVVADIATLKELADARKELILLYKELSNYKALQQLCSSLQLEIEQHTGKLEQQATQIQRLSNQVAIKDHELSKYHKTIFGLYRKKDK